MTMTHCALVITLQGLFTEWMRITHMRHIPCRQVVLSEKCRVFLAKCLSGENSVCQTVRSVRCSFDKVPFARSAKCFSGSVFRQNVGAAECKRPEL